MGKSTSKSNLLNTSLNTFIEEALVSTLVTRQEGNTRYIVFENAIDKDFRTYVLPEDFIQMVVECIRDDDKHNVGIIGKNGDAADWEDVSEDGFIEGIIARITGVVCWYFNKVSNAKITVEQKKKKKAKPKSKKNSSKDNVDNVIPFRPRPKGRKGRKGKR